MDRRELLGVLGAGAAGMVAMNGGTARAAGPGSHGPHVKLMTDCATACNEAAHHCLTELRKGGGQHADHHATAHEAAMDCQAFCTLAAALTARSSPYAKYAHQACADACRDCASACEGQPDDVMKECVKACQECEKACRKMGVSG